MMPGMTYLPVPSMIARVCGRVEVLADGGDLAVAQKHVGVLKRAVRDGEHSRIADQRFRRCWPLRACSADRQTC